MQQSFVSESLCTEAGPSAPNALFLPLPCRGNIRSLGFLPLIASPTTPERHRENVGQPPRPSFFLLEGNPPLNPHRLRLGPRPSPPEENCLVSPANEIPGNPRWAPCGHTPKGPAGFLKVGKINPIESDLRKPTRFSSNLQKTELSISTMHIFTKPSETNLFCSLKVFIHQKKKIIPEVPH